MTARLSPTLHDQSSDWSVAFEPNRIKRRFASALDTTRLERREAIKRTWLLTSLRCWNRLNENWVDMNGKNAVSV